MKRVSFTLILIMFCTAANAQYKNLVWSDEFNYKGLPNDSKWSYDTGGHGWGNRELQYYTLKNIENAQVKKGKLHIIAKKENRNGMKYTSARLVTKNKGDWKYGRIEVRAKLPKGRGIWPAIWMLPTKWAYGGWPKSGEIDIMEYVGYLPDSVFASVHTGAFNHAIGTNKTASIFKKKLSKKFHVYAIEWEPDVIRFYLNNNLYHEFRNTGKNSAEWPFDQDFHLLLNIAVGGNWGGKYGVDDLIFPQEMQVDYVRVYQ